MSATNRWIADLSDYSIKAYINRGYGLSEDGVTHTMNGIEFRATFDVGIFPMYAFDFKDYLDEQGIGIEDLTTIDLVAAAYDEDGNEIDFSLEYQKCAFVSEDSLNGYSDSDILPTANYKVYGSNYKTVIDVSSYTGYKSDGISLTDRPIEDGAGINMQFMNGDFQKIRCLILKSLVFNLAEEEEKEPEKTETPVEKEPVVPENIIEVDLNDPKIFGFENRGYGLMRDGVKKVDGALEFEYEFENDLYPMMAVSFQEYLFENNIMIADVASFEIQMGIYDADGNELDYSDEYQKCAFVSPSELNGYSASDILPSGNYKVLGSNQRTVFDLSIYDESMKSFLEEGVGFNIQVLNGDRSRIKCFRLNHLRFIMK